MTNIKPPPGYPPPKGPPVHVADEARRCGLSPTTLRSRMARHSGPPAWKPGGNGDWTTYRNWFERWFFHGGVASGKPDALKPGKREINAPTEAA